jgi:hypothetical protein
VPRFNPIVPNLTSPSLPGLRCAKGASEINPVMSVHVNWTGIANSEISESPYLLCSIFIVNTYSVSSYPLSAISTHSVSELRPCMAKTCWIR